MVRGAKDKKAAPLKKDRCLKLAIQILCTNEVFPLRNITNEMKISDVKANCEFSTGLPVNLQRLSYLDECDLLDDATVKSCDLAPGALLFLTVWNIWTKLVEATADNDTTTLFQVGVTEDSEYSTPNAEHMGAIARLEWLRNRAFTALYIACHRGHEELARKLIESGADVNASTPLGRTCLHVAAARGHGAIIDLLLANGAKINAEDKFGETALSIATAFGHKDCERHLFLFRWQQRAKQPRPGLKEEAKLIHIDYNDSAFPFYLQGKHSQLYYAHISPQAKKWKPPKTATTTTTTDTSTTEDKADSSSHYDEWLERKQELDRERLAKKRAERRRHKVAEADKKREVEFEHKSYDHWLTDKDTAPKSGKAKAGSSMGTKPAGAATTTQEVIQRIIEREEEEEREEREEGKREDNHGGNTRFWMNSNSAQLFQHIKDHGPNSLLHY